MADEYIKRSDAILAIQRHGVGSFDFEEDGWTPEQAERFVIGMLNKIPSADVVERKKGKWVGYPDCLKYTNAYADDHIVCSACEECFSILDNDCGRFNFCPNCGAKMEVDNENN